MKSSAKQLSGSKVPSKVTKEGKPPGYETSQPIIIEDSKDQPSSTCITSSGCGSVNSKAHITSIGIQELNAFMENFRLVYTRRYLSLPGKFLQIALLK